jgi:kynurenine formamidase
MGVMTVGVDSLSVEPFENKEVRVHHALLGAVVEPLVYYIFACLPPNLAGSDGIPARAVLVSDLQGGSAA